MPRTLPRVYLGDTWLLIMAAILVTFGLIIPFVGVPYLTFALFGIAFAIATPAIASLPAEILRPDSRASGFGIY